MRTVNIFSDSAFEWDELTSPNFIKKPEYQWYAHDLLHIIFYDFAALNLGKDFAGDRNRFFEIHLASELFAVLSLDYHHLVHTPVHGLAVDLEADNWKDFQRRVDSLPEMESFAFCRDLASLYLTGAIPYIDKKSSRASPTDRFAVWLGHEIRYAEKQRHYVLAWREDLEGKKASRKQISLGNTFVTEPLWELLQLFHDPKEELGWNRFLNEVQKSKSSRPQNYFETLPKFRRIIKILDFRFTDFKSFSKKKIMEILDEATKPLPSNLFLFWQVLSSFSLTLFSEEERRQIQALALASQASGVTADHWESVRRVALGRVERLSWTPDDLGRGTFFMP